MTGRLILGLETLTQWEKETLEYNFRKNAISEKETDMELKQLSALRKHQKQDPDTHKYHKENYPEASAGSTWRLAKGLRR